MATLVEVEETHEVLQSRGRFYLKYGFGWESVRLAWEKHVAVRNEYEAQLGSMVDCDC